MTSTTQSYEEALANAPEARGLETVVDNDDDLGFDDLDEDGEVILLPEHPDDMWDAYYERMAEQWAEDCMAEGGYV